MSEWRCDQHPPPGHPSQQWIATALGVVWILTKGDGLRTTQQILRAISSDRGNPQSLPDRICADCATALPATGVALALMNDSGHQAVVGASDVCARDLEQQQFEVGEGPSVDASRHNRPELHPDLEQTGRVRWPAFGPVAAAAGVRAAFAFPLQVGAIRVGSLGLYRGTAMGLGGEDGQTAAAYAEAALVVLLHLQDQAELTGRLHPDLDRPLAYRAEVHQATGYLSVKAAVGMTEALLLLRAQAFSAGRPLLDVARDVLAGRLHLGRMGDSDA